jgi:FlaA1/EpsC-like NDP-sugar epimerase
MKNRPFRLFLIQAVLTLLLFTLWKDDPAHHAPLYLVFGSLVSALQIGLLYFVWWRFFAKKKIAPSVFAVVIKYALLGFSFWYVYPLSKEQISALTMGILLNPAAIIIFAITMKWDEKEKKKLKS